MTQGKLLEGSKVNHGSTAETTPPEPPSYEEATADASPCYTGAYTDDGELLTQFNWDDRNIRRVFARKVYSILMIQLLVTLAIVALCVFCEPVKAFVHANPGWYWASYAVFLVTYLTICCCSAPRRKFPWNIILLALFTLSFSYMTGMLSSFYNTKSVLLCLGITVLVCLSVTLLSFFTKIDLTSCHGLLAVLSVTVFICGLMLAFVLPLGLVPWLHALYGVLGAILFTMFLAFDLQMVMGNRRYTISPEEYIFATLNIYVDIIYIFSFLLQLFGSQD
ncbi:protein lifeguard 2-like [Engraulis encrasicolus]|uniref:protein lifeguard 2-like n=1 Tax=Engraulis encrasicolus TaxID=184585 RepID=UPI002FD237FA